MRYSLDTLASALCYAIGVDAPEKANEINPELKEYIDSTLEGKKADRVFMYNPDAIGQWIYEKYEELLKKVTNRTDIKVEYETVMPSVTPVCFGTMYTGAQPSVHGIQKYEKPVLTIETVFDCLIKAGKKPVIIAQTNCSIAKIFLDREMDYFIYDTVEEINAKATEVIMEDKYDFVVVYNGNYDSIMHKFGPESIEALSALRANAEAFSMFDVMIKNHWLGHNTFMAFAMDHGCHEIDGGCGSHGLDMPEDLNIMHRYKIIKN